MFLIDKMVSFSFYIGLKFFSSHHTWKITETDIYILEECMDIMTGDECAKVVKKDQCEKKGEKCMKACGLCPGRYIKDRKNLYFN